jgi:hypothetical protein
VLVKGFVDHVVIVCAAQPIARHQRAYGTGNFVFDPLHYLALIETKPNALDQAAPLQGWELPEVFQHMRHLLEARMGNRGKREFIAILRLLEAMPQTVVTSAVTQAIQLGAIGFDAVKQIALARIERRPPGWICRPIPICPGPTSRPLWRPTIPRSFPAGRHDPRGQTRSDADGHHERHAAGVAGSPPQTAQAAHYPARVRQGGHPLRP